MYTPSMVSQLVLPMERPSSSHTAHAHGLAAPVLGLFLRMSCCVVPFQFVQATVRAFAGSVTAHDVAVQADGTDDDVGVVFFEPRAGRCAEGWTERDWVKSITGLNEIKRFAMDRSKVLGDIRPQHGVEEVLCHSNRLICGGCIRTTVKCSSIHYGLATQGVIMCACNMEPSYLRLVIYGAHAGLWHLIRHVHSTVGFVVIEIT
jgi:hypothetical protein